MKKRICLLLVAVMLLTVMVPAVSVGAADSENTYVSSGTERVITTEADFVAFYKEWDKSSIAANVTVKLAADLTFNNTDAADWYTGSSVTKLVGSGNTGGAFLGTFDGQGHSISGLYLEDLTSWDLYVGLFGILKTTSCVKNLTIENFYVNGQGKNCGVLASYIRSGAVVDNVTIKNGTIAATGDVYVAPLAGAIEYNNEGDQVPVITNCAVENVTVDATSQYKGAVAGCFVTSKTGSGLHYWDFTGSYFKVDLPMFGKRMGNGTNAYVINNAYGYATSFWDGLSNTVVSQRKGGDTWFGKDAVAPNEKIVGYQLIDGTPDAVRFIGLVKDYADLNKLGFQITVNGVTKNCEITKVYTSLLAEGQTVAAPEGYYYFTFVITGVPANTTFTVTTYTDDVEHKSENANRRTACTSTAITYTYAPEA